MYISHNEKDIKEIFNKLNIKNINELFSDIPEKIYKKNKYDIKQYNLLDLENKIDKIEYQNNKIFLGGGIYNHYIPPIVDTISSRAEFYTAYTPYQPEISQGTLQYIYEYQSMLSLLTDMDIANASMYDGSTALVEAINTAYAYKKSKNQNTVLIPENLNYRYKEVINTYLNNKQNINIKYIPYNKKTGQLLYNEINKHIDESFAFIIQSPNYFGVLEDYDELEKINKNTNNITKIMFYYPISLGLLKTPGELGFDIAIAEGQSFGLKMNYGGPLLGMFSAKKKYLRKMPGRIVSLTKDAAGKDCFTLTLQTREQHIKRERATSNICSNQSLCALQSLLYFVSLGQNGLKYLAELIYNRTEYFKEKINKLINLKFTAPTFNEFIIEFNNEKQLNDFLQISNENNIYPGINLKNKYENCNNSLSVCITEKNSIEDINKYINLLGKIK